MNLEINLTENVGQSILSVSGEIDAYTAPKLKDSLTPLMLNKGQVVIVDLEEVNYMDSTGLGVFISALKSAKEYESQLKIVNIQERVYRLFQITGLHEIMDLKATIKGGND